MTRRLNPTRHLRDTFHAWMLTDAEYAGKLDMPVLSKTKLIPSGLISFSDAMRANEKDYDKTVHFFEDDYLIERFWNRPSTYIKKLSKFEGVIGLDYSVCWDFPIIQKNYNHFRNSICTYWLQKNLPVVVPQARCELDDYDEVLAGFPKHSSIAIGARSMVKDKKDRKKLKESVKCIVDYLEPLNLIWYGSNAYGVADYAIKKVYQFTFSLEKERGACAQLVARGCLMGGHHSGGLFGNSSDKSQSSSLFIELTNGDYRFFNDMKNQNFNVNKNMREHLLKLSRTDQCSRIVEELYRKGASIGDGGTADAIRKELATGDLTGKKDHIRKGKERLKQIEKILKNNPNHPDRQILEFLANDLRKALGGK